MNDTITIPNDYLQTPILQFVQASCLANCTAWIHITGNPIVVTTQWPVAGFSSGEVVAWSILRSLVEGDLRRMFERLDSDNIGALIACLALTREAVLA